jgi:hypothetical protein
MAAKWVEKLKAKIAANPLFEKDGVITCQACGGTGKKVALYRITNYNYFNTCSVCKRVYR